MNQCEQPVSGSDIYHKLGALEGKVDALIVKTSEYKTDLQNAFDRIRHIENRQSWMIGGVVVISSLVPIVMNLITNTFQLKLENSRSERMEYIRNI